MTSNEAVDFDFSKIDTRCVFLDCGSFSQWELSAKYAKKTGRSEWDYYKTKKYKAYVDGYAAFVKKYPGTIDLYSNMDVIPNPELTWRNQLYLENTHGLKPIPVVHYRTDLKWLKKYMDRGHKIISLGGLVGSAKQSEARHWIDACFDMACDGPGRLPQVRIHGFGITSYNLMIRYPWWSVDSSSWAKAGAFGKIFVPHKRSGAFVFTEPPYAIDTSFESPTRHTNKWHVLNMPQMEVDIVKEWLREVDIPYGSISKSGGLKTLGVINNHSYRKAANMRFFQQMCKALPKWPWPWTGNSRPGFGVF